jgi:type I restriction-modification system DNA methylase subunit
MFSPLNASQLKKIEAIIQDFIDSNAINTKESNIQANYIVDIVKLLGWNRKTIEINPKSNVKTGKVLDVLLKNENDEPIFIIEAKQGKERLDGGRTSIINGLRKTITYSEQLIGYCKTEGLSWGILTNFSEWRIYSVVTGKLYFNKKFEIIKDNKINSADVAELFKYLYAEALVKADGRIDENPLYYQSVDDIKQDFFKKLKNWRSTLRANLHVYYKEQLSTSELDSQTQRILDRIIFISYCHKKRIINIDVLSAVLTAERISYYDQLKKTFADFNEKYNSDIFAETKCDRFKIDNEVIQPIIEGINSINFSQLDVHIIGEVYENLQTTKSHVKTDDAKERLKRKSQGIYYTPDYIVEYIVNNTIGELLSKCKKIEEVEAIKVLDPSCGSGSFLIKAFDLFYEKYETLSGGGLFKGLEISKKILTHNLFGIDLDERAVEIAKLNLLLKAMEKIGETVKTGRKILPNLSLNICFGNSLISGKIENGGNGNLFGSGSDYKGRLNKLVALKERFYRENDNDEMYRILHEIQIHEKAINNDFNDYLTSHYFRKIDEIKPLNYDVKFCDVFKHNGFHCIIGNPPWGADLSAESLKYLKDENKEIIVRMIDTYMYFVKKSFDLLKDDGYFGMILPDVLLYQTDNYRLREFILANAKIRTIINVGNVFDGVIRPTCILTYLKGKSDKNVVRICDLSGLKIEGKKKYLKNERHFELINQAQFLTIPNYSFITKNYNLYQLLEKIRRKNPRKLIEFIDSDGIQRGVSPDFKDAFIVTAKQVKENNLEAKYIRRVITGGTQIKRYFINRSPSFLIYTRHDDDFEKIPKIKKFIDQYKSKITCKEVKEHKHPIHALHRPREERIFTKKEKLLGVITEDEIIVALDDKKTFATDGVYLMGVINTDIKYVMAVLNSKLFLFLYRLFSFEEGRAMAQVKPTILNELPFHPINLKNPFEKKSHSKILSLVDEITKLKSQKNENEIETLAISKQIDDLVYKIYGISDKDILTIEKSFASLT